jgi:hypothetical protein
VPQIGFRPQFSEEIDMSRATSVAPPGAETLREAKIRASLLLKAVRSADSARSLAAAERFRVLPAFAAMTPERIVAWAESLRRKHALSAVAIEMGYVAWNALKDACSSATTSPNVDWLFDTGAVYLNHWCTTYEEARRIREQVGGFLFPYRRQFVVCSAERLASRGIDAYDPDWARIGFDWVQPRDATAFTRLASVMNREW